MIPIKIQCACGQRYSFEIEPVAGEMLGGVACPACGSDGTAAANALLAEHLQQDEPAVPSSSGVMSAVASSPGTLVAAPPVARIAAVHRVGSVSASSSAPATPASAGRLPGQLAPEQAKIEARAKIMWGDDPAEVQKFLLMHGYSIDEARETIAPLLDDRAQSIRKSGLTKALTGVAMMCVPLIAFFVFKAIGVFPLKIFGATLALGAWGAWRVISGTIMFLSPRSEQGDVSEM